MSQPRPTRLPKLWRDELEACGLPWRIENGRKHFKLLIDGKLAGVFSHGANMDPGPCSEMSMVLNIRRVAAARKRRK